MQTQEQTPASDCLRTLLCLHAHWKILAKSEPHQLHCLQYVFRGRFLPSGVVKVLKTSICILHTWRYLQHYKRYLNCATFVFGTSMVQSNHKFAYLYLQTPLPTYPTSLMIAWWSLSFSVASSLARVAVATYAAALMAMKHFFPSALNPLRVEVKHSSSGVYLQKI